MLYNMTNIFASLERRCHRRRRRRVGGAECVCTQKMRTRGLSTQRIGVN